MGSMSNQIQLGRRTNSLEETAWNDVLQDLAKVALNPDVIPEIRRVYRAALAALLTAYAAEVSS